MMATPSTVGRGLTLLVGLAMLLSACAPSAQNSRTDQASAPNAPSSPSTPKTLRIGITADAEPKEGGIAFGTSGAGGFEAGWLLHSFLTNYNDQTVLEARIAERVPTLENGDWKVNADGTMDVTWKLRPNVRWHDGTPLSAEDFVLGYKVGADADLGLSRGTRVLRQIADISSPDPQTLNVKWKNVYIYANVMDQQTLVPLPNHKLGALYDSGDRQGFLNSTAWAEDWVGLGPYKMKEWLRGSFIEAEAFDGYFMGRPKIDRVTIRWIGDTNTLIVSTISGDLDLVPVGSLKEEEAHVLKTQYETQGSGTVTLSANKLRNGQWQWRDPNAVWMQDVRIRHGLQHFIDRQSIVDTVQNGLSKVDDIVLAAQDPAYRLVQQRGLPDSSFDVNLGHRMLTEAGLTRGPNGTYRTAAGVPLAFEMSTTGDINSNVQELLALSNAWKTAGAEPTHVIIPGTGNKEEARGTLKGINLTSSDLSYRSFESHLTAELSTEGTRWRGSNHSGFSNQAFDDLYKRLLTTVSSSERDPMAADLVKILRDNAVYMPLSYSSDVSVARKGLRNVTGVFALQRVTAWNAHTWEWN
jgi:peptide/nickel transport system substrate-binding protein